MIISSLRTAAFRNLADATVFTQAKNVFLVGENGQGKSNFLEALYFCSYASSFRGSRDSEIVQNNKKDFSAAITVVDRHDEPRSEWRGIESLSTNKAEHSNNEILIKFEKGKKTVFISGKSAEDRKDLLSVAPCIVFCHEDMEFVAGSPERRRWFFDQVLSLSDPVYLDDLRRYRWVLKSRNSILRDILHNQNSDSRNVLDALDWQFVLYGLKLMEKREAAANLFSQVFDPLYKEVSGISGMSVQYIPSWKNTSEDEAYLHVQHKHSADMGAGVSLSGPHRDRYSFTLNGSDFTGKASTGQRRLLALLLRVAQARRYCQTSGKNPILLLDDVLLEMDGEKRRRFISALPTYDQAFYTFLPDEPYQYYRSDDTLVYYVKEGRLEAEQ